MSSIPSASATPKTPPTGEYPSRMGEPRSLLEAIGWTSVIRIVILGALVVAVYRHPLSGVLFRWRTDGNWSHGWLVPLFSLYFLHVNRGALAAATRRTNYWGLAILIATLAGFFATFVYPYSYPRSISIIGMMIGVTLFLGGWAVMRVVWLPIVFLIFAIPLPDNIYVELTMPLRKLASVVSASLLGMIPGAHTDVSGVVIDYSYRGSNGSLNVEEACSGMRLMMAFITLGVAMAYLGNRPLRHRIVMIASCVPIAVFCNMIRVTTTGALYMFDMRDLTTGTPHALLGLAMLPIALSLFALSGWVLNNLFIEDPSEAGTVGAD